MPRHPQTENRLSIWDFDKQFQRNNENPIGIDEAGRGPLAGPVVAAAVQWPINVFILNIDDSKKLSEKKRDILSQQIYKTAKLWSIAWASEREIDELNIYQASKLAMQRALQSITVSPNTQILTDAMPLDKNIPNCHPIKKGDQKSAAIAAASILAKTYRDSWMKELAVTYPGYGFEKHKGYPTKQHLENLHKLGICNIHRRSYAPVRLVIESQEKEK